MANEGHLRVLKQGPDAWHQWRQKNREIQPDLSDSNLCGASLSGMDLRDVGFSHTELLAADLHCANLSGADLLSADLRGANLSGAIFTSADLTNANLSGTDLTGAILIKADLSLADLSGATLIRAKLSHANLDGAKLINADLREADLSGAILNETNFLGANLSNAELLEAHLTDTNFEKATLVGCRIYGISAWGVKVNDAKQEDLIITRPGEPTITVDNLEVAQFIYLLLHNEKIRKIIDTITSKVVLILGRFTSRRKDVLDTIRKELRNHNYSPVLFDFQKPGSRDFTETISTLAHLSRFIIVDITDPQSVPQELYAIVPHMRSVPVQPILEGCKEEYGMFEDFKKYPWVLEVYRYNNLDVLVASMKEKIINPAEAKLEELKRR